MNRQFFQTQVNRLVSTYGETHYKIERIEIIWREVKDLSDSWFSKTIDKLIGESRFAPLMPEFREEISRERDRGWATEKVHHDNQSQDFFQDTIPSEEKKIICQMIRQIGNPNMSEAEKESIRSSLNNLVKTKKGE